MKRTPIPRGSVGIKRSAINRQPTAKARETAATWSEVKAARRVLVGDRCEMCGRLGTEVGPLQGHHRLPRRYRVHTVENCRLLCDPCHDRAQHGGQWSYDNRWLLKCTDPEAVEMLRAVGSKLVPPSAAAVLGQGGGEA